MSPDHFILQSIVPVRATASDAAEMVTQLLFGELVTVLERDRQWRRIRNADDDYEGWIDEKMLVELPVDWLTEVETWEFVRALYVPIAHVYGEEKRPLRLTFGARIPIPASQQRKSVIDLKIGAHHFRIPRSGLYPPTQLNAAGLIEQSFHFMGAPYLWGGKSPWGVDCSGFVQVLYRIAGIQIPRDASQQVGVGRRVDFADQQAGDLAFFQNDKGKIHHVGLVLPGGKIRHAHGHVRDDQLTESGIVQIVSEIQTHRLWTIQRIL